MTVGELRKVIIDLPDDMEIVVCGHFGEGIRMISQPHVTEAKVVNAHWEFRTPGSLQQVLAFPYIDIGEEPD
jgi:hypothetical protein